MTSKLHPQMPPDYEPIVGNKVAVRKKWVMDFHTIFDGKDDQNYIRKTLTMLKYSTPTALLWTMADVILLDRQGFVATARRALFWGVPIIGGGLAYTTIVAASASLRKKDGRVNHLIGGFAAGSVLGAARKSVPNGLLAGGFAALFGVLYKSSKLEGWEMIQDLPPQAVGYPLSYKYDFTVMKDYPANWVRKLPKDEC